MTIAEWPTPKLEAVLAALGWVPQEWQMMPTRPESWWAWLMIGGR